MIRKLAKPGKRGKGAGFTIIELMIVIAIIAILASIAVARYERSVWRAKEAVLRQDLFTLRTSIDQYTLDKQKAPQSLDDLATAGYIKSVPKDPITNSNSTWVTEQEDSLMAVDQTSPGIVDVHSGSDQQSTEGTPYNSW
jgi:general secretion pathway protein G